MIKIATWNINSVRIRLDLIQRWIKKENPDIILLQETKCINELFPTMDFNLMGYNCLFSGQKSYNGVAILSKNSIENIHLTLPLYQISQQDDEARYVEGVINFNSKIFRVASVYVPNGDSVLEKGEKLEDSKRFNYKLNFFKRLQKRMVEVQNYDEFVVFGGDYNVAHNEIDLNSPKTAKGKVGFHDLERNALTNIINCGYTDIFRHQHPGVVEYSWWDYRRQGWNLNRGWRIDYLMLNNYCFQNANVESYIDKSTRAEEKTSDHVPVVCTIKIK